MLLCFIFFCLIFKSHSVCDYRNNCVVPAECSAPSLGAGAPGLGRVRSLRSRFPVRGRDRHAHRQFRQDDGRCDPGVRPALVSEHSASPWSSLPPPCQLALRSKLTYLVHAGAVTARAPGKAVSENLLVAPRRGASRQTPSRAPLPARSAVLWGSMVGPASEPGFGSQLYGLRHCVTGQIISEPQFPHPANEDPT